MPTIFQTEKYRFFFFSLDRNGPPHVHVEHGDKLAKYWLDPVELARSEGFRAHELNQVRALVVAHRVEFKRRWDEHFSREASDD